MDKVWVKGELSPEYVTIFDRGWGNSSGGTGNPLEGAVENGWKWLELLAPKRFSVSEKVGLVVSDLLDR